MTVRRLHRPPKGARCDMSIGSGQDYLGAPVVLSCTNPATLTALAKTGVVWEYWLCESCWSKKSEMFIRRVPEETSDAG